MATFQNFPILHHSSSTCNIFLFLCDHVHVAYSGSFEHRVTLKMLLGRMQPCKLQCPLRKHAYSNILKISPPKAESFQKKTNLLFLYISAQNIDCGYLLEPPCRGGSNEYPQSMFLSRSKKINVYPCKPQFYYIKWGLRVYIFPYNPVWLSTEMKPKGSAL